MKNYQLLSIFFLCCFLGISTLSAQTKFIPKAGVNLSYFAGDLGNPQDEVKGDLGYQVGVAVRFGEGFYVEPGVQYFQRNALLERTGGVNVSDLNVDFALEGLRVPVYLGFDLFSSERLGLRLYGGPSMVFLFDNSEDFVTIREYALKDNLWSMNAGAGLDLGIITVDLVHEWGVSNVFDLDGATSKNNVFYLSAGLLF